MVTGEDIHTQLRQAATSGDLDTCKKLLEDGANLNKNQVRTLFFHFVNSSILVL